MKMHYLRLHGDFLVWVLCLAWIGWGESSFVLAAELVPQPIEFDGEFIYKDHCSVCHGDHGDGRSRASNSLVPPPRNFTVASDLTRDKMIATVTNGKQGTAMTSWKTQLNPKQIEAVVDYVRGRFMRTIIDRNLASGRLVYGHNCATCHGEQGHGVKDQTGTTPRSFFSPSAKMELTRERMMNSVTHGLPGTAMEGYSEKLSAEHIEAVVDYIYTVLMVDNVSPGTEKADKLPVDMNLPMPYRLVGDVRLGEQFFMGNCATCHGQLGNGQGPRAYFMASKPRNFLDDSSHTTLNRPAIFSAVTLGLPGTEMPAWGKVLSEQEIANVAEFVFQRFISPSAH
ncbi:MAG: c-type cytochrome [Gallionellaceae bacterium]|nr:c-type cytochrome [Gallionellaceae bacterium]